VEKFSNPFDIALPTPADTAVGRSSPTTKARARIRATSTPRDLRVVSDLTNTEPVTEAEIALVLAVLGDMLVNIVSPENPA
jgi:hypothetical protein